jgi:OmpA-OmpF porin, OOP family
MNLLDSLKSYITPELVSSAASQLGESEGGIQKALGAALPTVLSAVMNKTQEGGPAAEGMFSLLQGAGTSGLLNNLGGLFGAGANKASSETASTGNNLLNTLFGDKLGGISSSLSSVAGVGSSSASSLLSAGASLVAGFLGNKINSEGLGLGGLATMLAGQKDSIMGALPGGMGNLLGMAGLGGAGNAIGAAVSNAGSAIGEAANSTVETVGDPEDGFGNALKTIIPLFLIGALAFFFLRGCDNKKPAATVGAAADSVGASLNGTADSLATGASVAMDSAGSAIGAGMDSLSADVKARFAKLGALTATNLPNGVSLNIPANGVESQLVKFIMDPATKSMTADQFKEKWFDFDRLLFDTGKSTIRRESQEQINNIAEIMKAFPTLKLKVGGYTDNTGNAKANLKLSADRAKAVMTAVVAKGADAARLSSEGYGVEHPMADNATAEGREKNRRVSARVVSL